MKSASPNRRRISPSKATDVQVSELFDGCQHGFALGFEADGQQSVVVGDDLDGERFIEPVTQPPFQDGDLTGQVHDDARIAPVGIELRVELFQPPHKGPQQGEPDRLPAMRFGQLPDEIIVVDGRIHDACVVEVSVSVQWSSS